MRAGSMSKGGCAVTGLGVFDYLVKSGFLSILDSVKFYHRRSLDVRFRGTPGRLMLS